MFKNHKISDENYSNDKKMIGDGKKDIIETKTNKLFKLENKQKIMMNNYKQTNISNPEFILKNIYSTDDEIYNQIYKQLDNQYQKKLNIMIMILKSNLIIPLNDQNQIINFFNWMSPLNLEFNMGSKDWAVKKIKYGDKEKFLLQNSISKKDIGKNFYSNYIDLIKNKLNLANVDYLYFEFKSKRFNKIKDIIWVLNI